MFLPGLPRNTTNEQSDQYRVSCLVTFRDFELRGCLGIGGPMPPLDRSYLPCDLMADHSLLDNSTGAAQLLHFASQTADEEAPVSSLGLFGQI